MTLDKVIKQNKETAEKMRRKAEGYTEDLKHAKDGEVWYFESKIEDCIRDAEEHEQLADWLTKLDDARKIIWDTSLEDACKIMKLRKLIDHYLERDAMRLIDADELKKYAIPCAIHNGALTDMCVPLYQIDNAPTVEAYTSEQVKELVDLNKKLSEAKPQGKWVKIFENPFTNGYVCPFCGHKIQVTEQFLPKVTECESCGADMREELEE